MCIYMCVCVSDLLLSICFFVFYSIDVEFYMTHVKRLTHFSHHTLTCSSACKDDFHLVERNKMFVNVSISLIPDYNVQTELELQRNISTD